MRSVNLLPRQQVERKRERPEAVILVAAIGGAAVLLALIGGFLLANRSVDRQQQALTSAQAVLALTPKHTLSAKTQAYRTNVLNQRQQRSLALASALGKRVAWDRVLRHVTLVMPGDVWLTNIIGNTPLDPVDPATGLAPTTTPTTPSAFPAPSTDLTIQGYTYTQAGVARFLERLDVLPDLKNVQLQNSEKAQVGTQTVVNFTIVAAIRNGKGNS
jgi:Tfp pilus assembly protein PilN